MNRLFNPMKMIIITLTMMISVLSYGASLPDFTGLVDEASPAVVNISTEQTVAAKANTQQFDSNSEELNEFFRRFFGQQQPFGQQAPKQRSSLGSGFIISDDGYVLTNNHVIDGADTIHVRLSDRREYIAELVGTDSRTDLALLKIEASGLPTVNMGDSDDLKPGQWVLAIGSPFGFDYTVTAGIVSATGRNLPSDSYVPFIQTDVAINPGNSGGPLFNLEGEVIGINSQIYTRSGGFMGVSFAIPSNVAMSVAEQLKNDGKVSRAWLGVLIQDVNNDLAESFGLDRSRGALVSRVLPNSPAEKSGLRSGDIIMSFKGKNIERSGELPYLVGQMKAGDKVQTQIYRDGKEQTLSIILDAMPNDPQAITQSQQAQNQNRLGMVVGELPADMAKQFNIESGVVIEQVIGGTAARNGLQQGDVITMLSGQHINSVSDFNTIVNKIPNGRSVPMRVIRQGYPMFIPFRIIE